MQDNITYPIDLSILQFPKIDKAVIFDFRAMGNYRKGSDVDLAIYGEGITHLTQNRLSSLLNEELPLPYYFDVIDYTHLSHKKLSEHIRNFGKELL